MSGKSVKPPQPPNLWKSVSMVSSSTFSFAADTGDQLYRRSVYAFWKRAMPPPQMTIFDAPTRESCIARRERTNTPLQALVLMNEGQFFHAARKFARQLLAMPDMRRTADSTVPSPPPAQRKSGGEGRVRGGKDSSAARLSEDDRLILAYESVTSHLPDPIELSNLRNGLHAFQAIYQDDTAAAKALTADLDDATDQERIEAAAYTMLMNSLFNLDVAKTRE
jgi:hypothetical protein